MNKNFLNETNMVDILDFVRMIEHASPVKRCVYSIIHQVHTKTFSAYQNGKTFEALLSFRNALVQRGYYIDGMNVYTDSSKKVKVGEFFRQKQIIDFLRNHNVANPYKIVSHLPYPDDAFWNCKQNKLYVLEYKTKSSDNVVSMLPTTVGYFKNQYKKLVSASNIKKLAFKTVLGGDYASNNKYRDMKHYLKSKLNIDVRSNNQYPMTDFGL